MYKIAAENLQALFQKIAADQDLYLPVKVSDQVNFRAWSQDAEVCLDTLKTVKSPKDAFFPQSENLYTCEKEGKNITIEPQALQEKNFVVFGMKACDVQGVKVLDNVFLSDPVDTFYAARREHGTIVALACHEPEESCFCKVFGVVQSEIYSTISVTTKAVYNYCGRIFYIFIKIVWSVQYTPHNYAIFFSYLLVKIFHYASTLATSIPHAEA